MLLIAAPGQGAQAPGFLREWLELPGFSERLGSWSELAGCLGALARRGDEKHPSTLHCRSSPYE